MEDLREDLDIISGSTTAENTLGGKQSMHAVWEQTGAGVGRCLF